MDVQLPLYRAKKIDSDEWVEGYYCEHKFLDFEKKVRKVFNVISSEFEETESMGFIFLPCIKLGRSEYYQKIDPSTLTVSFDNGENFDSISFVTRAVEDHREATRIQK